MRKARIERKTKETAIAVEEHSLVADDRDRALLEHEAQALRGRVPITPLFPWFAPEGIVTLRNVLPDWAVPPASAP